MLSLFFSCENVSPAYQQGAYGMQAQLASQCAVLSKSDQLSQEIKRIAELPQGWDGYNAPPTAPVAIEKANKIAKSLDDAFVPFPNIGPVIGGGVQFEWYSGAKSLEVEIFPDGTLTYLRVERDEPIDEGQLSIKTLRQQMLWLIGA